MKVRDVKVAESLGEKESQRTNVVPCIEVARAVAGTRAAGTVDA